MSERSVVSSPDAPQAIGPYSQGIKAGGFVFLSGQIPLVGPTGKIAQGMIKEQTEQVILNIQALLASEGLTLDDVVKADLHDAFSAELATGRTRPAPWRSRATLAMMVKTAMSARMDADAKAPAAW